MRQSITLRHDRLSFVISHVKQHISDFGQVKRIIQRIQLAIIISIRSVGIAKILCPIQKQYIGMLLRKVGTTRPSDFGQSTQYYQDITPFRSHVACVKWNGLAGIGGTVIILVFCAICWLKQGIQEVGRLKEDCYG